MNPLKKYFLFISRIKGLLSPSPFLNSIVPALLILFVLMLIDLLATLTIFDRAVGDVIFVNILGYIAIFSLVHMLVHYIVTKKYIILPYYEYSVSPFYVVYKMLIFQDGKVVIVKKPIWGKNLYFYEFLVQYSSTDENKVEVTMKIDVQLKNFKFILPIKFSTELDKDPDVDSLYKVIKESYGERPRINVDVSKILLRLVLASNESKKKDLEALVKGFAEQKISEDDFMLTMKELIVLPDNFLVGPEKIKFDLLLPKIDMAFGKKL